MTVEQSVATAPRTVAVLGMHRSGTSMMTRILNVLGTDLGPENELMPAHSVDNPTGYWEHSPMVEFNDRLLDSLGGTWDAPPVLRDGWQWDPSITSYRDEAEAIVRPFRASSQPIGFKDPRLCLLLPFWQTVTPITEVVLVTRHPFQVAASLTARDDMGSEEAAELWSRYMIAAWRAHPRRAVIGYEYTLADPLSGIEQLAMFLGLATPTAESLQTIAGHVRADLNRHADHVPDVGPKMALALAFHALVESQEFSLIDRVADAIHAEWEATIP